MTTATDPVKENNLGLLSLFSIGVAAFNLVRSGLGLLQAAEPEKKESISIAHTVRRAAEPVLQQTISPAGNRGQTPPIAEVKEEGGLLGGTAGRVYSVAATVLSAGFAMTNNFSLGKIGTLCLLGGLGGGFYMVYRYWKGSGVNVSNTSNVNIHIHLTGAAVPPRVEKQVGPDGTNVSITMQEPPKLPVKPASAA